MYYYTLLFEKVVNSMIEKVSIKEIIEILKRRLLIIIFAVVCITSLIIFPSMYLLKPVYQHSTQVLAGSLGIGNEESTVNNMQENRQLVLSYMDVIKSPSIMGAVKDELNLSRSSYQLLEQISVTNRENSQIVTISVKDNNPELTKSIAQTIAEQSISKFKIYADVGNMSIIDDSMILDETELLFPKPKFILAIAIVVSFFIGIGLAVVREYTDDTIYGEGKIEHLGLTILGKAKINTKNKKGKQKVLNNNAISKERSENAGY